MIVFHECPGSDRQIILAATRGGFFMKANTLLALAASMVLAAPVAEARITKVIIDPALSQSPTFGGYAWPGVGQYERLIGTAYGEVNPSDRKNSVIVDVGLAPRNASGNVEYSFDFYILKPIDLKKGAHKLMYEPPNRGGKTWNTFGRVPGGNDPGGTIVDPVTLANAFLMPRGYTMVWSGWDKAAGTNTAKTALSPTTFTLTYPAATLDKSKAKLTHRVHLDDPPVEVPASGWTYNATGTSINLVPAGWVANDIYEFSYT